MFDSTYRKKSDLFKRRTTFNKIAVMLSETHFFLLSMGRYVKGFLQVKFRRCNGKQILSIVGSCLTFPAEDSGFCVFYDF